jgi:hypothetical protein
MVQHAGDAQHAVAPTVSDIILGKILGFLDYSWNIL